MNLRPIHTIGGSDNSLNARWDALYERAHATRASRIESLEIPSMDRIPTQDMCVIYRIPNEYKGAIEIPDEFKGRHDSPYSVGVLLDAGAEALDVLESHGVLSGDYVTFGRYAGEEVAAAKVREAIDGYSEKAAKAIAEGIYKEEGSKKKLLKLRVAELHESIDLFNRLYGESPTMRRVRFVDKNGRVTHLIQPV